MVRKRLFYGWVLAPVGWIIYGFGVAPGYYSWGLFLPHLITDLELTHAQVGAVFSLFLLCGAGAGPLVGLAISRWGIRWLMAGGLLVAALGYFLTSRATSFADCLVGYAILVGLGHAFSLVIPFQTLAANWFVQYRARVTAFILTAGSLVGPLYLFVDVWVLREHSWREGWVLIAAVNGVVAVLAALFVRTSPEEMGLLPDGRAAEPAAQTTTPEAAVSGPPQASPSWTPTQALRTPQFFLMVVCGLGYAVPWAVINAYSGDHLENLGFESGVAASLIGTMPLVSLFGRLSGSLSDFLAPQKVLGVALLLEGLGAGGLLFADSAALVRVAFILVGLGFGGAYISIAAVFASFFGRRAFAVATGIRFLIGGVFASLAPVATGLLFDSTGSYNLAFTLLMLLSVIGGAVAFVSRPPRPKSATSPEPPSAR